MGAMTPVSNDDPLMVAWNEYKASEEYQYTKKWAAFEEHVDGSLWAAFLAGWSAANTRGRHDPSR